LILGVKALATNFLLKGFLGDRHILNFHLKDYNIIYRISCKRWTFEI